MIYKKHVLQFMTEYQPKSDMSALHNKSVCVSDLARLIRAKTSKAQPSTSDFRISLMQDAPLQR